MRWTEGHESPDVIDRRGAGRGGAGLGGLLTLLPRITRFRGGWLIALLLLGFVLIGGMGGLGGILGQSDESSTSQSAPLAPSKSADKKAQFVGFVLDDTQTMWRELFARRNTNYRNAKLVMFTDATETACGFGQAASGPFYCPTDERVYIDLSFYNELERRLGAGGDFAQAYVIAHEIGHHVQHQMGVADRVRGARGGSQRGEDSASVRLELQADCFAGIWAHSSDKRDILEPGDIDEALGAAAAIGDDTLQRQAGSRVRPESWTHGSSAQRSRWFKTGYERGTLEACDTFNTSVL